MSHPRPKAVRILLAALALTITACGESNGQSGGEGDSGIASADLHWTVKPLADLRPAREIPRMDQGSSPYAIQVARVLDAEHIDGVWVSAVQRGPASRAGIGPGDLVTSINGDEVTTIDDIDAALDDVTAGSTIEVDGLYIVSGDATQFLDPWSAEVKLPQG
jgi:membrane-associated protease RseP (regulator of RpoE activity)